MDQLAHHDGYVSSSMDDSMVGGGGVPTINTHDPEGARMTRKGRRKTGEVDLDLDAPRGRVMTLGGDRVRDRNRPGVVRELDGGSSGVERAGLWGTNVRAGGMGREHVLGVSSVKTYLSMGVETSEDLLEGSNSDDSREYT
jgi:hypothetical protein